MTISSSSSGAAQSAATNAPQESQSSTAASTTTAPQKIAAGRNVSGRPWKALRPRPQKRASRLVKTAANNRRSASPWEQKQEARRAQLAARELERELREQTRQEALQKKRRRLENETRRAENELKAVQQSAQPLNYGKVGATLKAMSKKQLRQIKKTRLNLQTGTVEYVSAYAK